MSFKVNRIKEEKESYNTTVGWINDFFKKSNFQDRVKERRDHPSVEKFSTIEDKMEDMKSRVGFDKLKNIKTSGDSSSKINKIAGGCGGDPSDCSCKASTSKGGSECIACKKNQKIDSSDELKAIKQKIENLLLYVEDLIMDRGYSTKAEVYGHCKNVPQLQFHNLSKNIDHEKFEKHLNKLFLRNSDSDYEPAKYISRDLFAEEGAENSDDMTPSYFKSHNM
tara:strand:+ start:721 stop:1389 length:669 start_codon:yes stop_codon:yes gene_type:complete